LGILKSIACSLSHRALGLIIFERNEAIRHKLVDRVQPLNVSLQEVIFVLDPILDKILKLFHFYLNDNFIDLCLLWGFIWTILLPRRGLNDFKRNILEEWVRLKEILLAVEILRLEK
jgi:hypothetical protein